MFAVVYEYGETPKFYETDLSKDDLATYAKAKGKIAEMMLFVERPFFISEEDDIKKLDHEEVKELIESQKRKEYVQEHNKKIDDQIRLLTTTLPMKEVRLNPLNNPEAIQALIEEGYNEIARTISQVTLVKYLDGYEEAYAVVKDQIESLQKQRLDQ